jgi:5S rRNA maturation endonuclease (ribonuclease M5)
MIDNNEALQSQILEYLRGVGIRIGTTRSSSGNIMFGCPFAPVSGHRNSIDSKPSFGIKMTDEGFKAHCFTCKRSFRTFVAFMLELQKEGLVKTIGNPYQIQNSFKVVFPRYNERIDVAPDETRTESIEEAVKHFDANSKEFLDYNLNKRGLTKDILVDANLLYDMKNKQTVFPQIDNGKLVGYVSHYIDGRLPKYANNFNTESYLYLGWLSKAKTAIVVEGMYDALRIYMFLKQLKLLERFSVVGCFGSNVGLHQVSAMRKKFAQLILMGDNDQAGIDMEKRIYTRLSKQVPLIWRARYDYQDPAKIPTAKTLAHVLEGVTLYKSIV